MSTNKRSKGSAAKANGHKTHTRGKVAPLKSTDSRKSRPVKSGAKTKSAKSAPTVSYDQIAQRAASIWHKRGCTSGQDEQNWHEAEAQLKDELGVE